MKDWKMNPFNEFIIHKSEERFPVSQWRVCQAILCKDASQICKRSMCAGCCRLEAKVSVDLVCPAHKDKATKAANVDRQLEQGKKKRKARTGGAPKPSGKTQNKKRKSAKTTN